MNNMDINKYIKDNNVFHPNEELRKEYSTKFVWKKNWVLSDWTIKNYVRRWIIWLETTNKELVTQEQILNHTNVSTTDVTLAYDFKRQQNVEWWVIDTMNKNQKIEFEEFTCTKEEWLIVYPWDFILWRTNEVLDLPSFIDCIIIWRSSIARQGLQMECAGYIDWWFRGTITLEITNFSKFPIRIYPGQRIGQLRFEFLDAIPELHYWNKKDSKYQWQIETTISRLNKDKIL